MHIMKKSNFAVVLIVFFSGWAAHVKGQSAPDQMHQAALLTKVLDQNHFSPISRDDLFSKKVFDAFLESVDPAKLFFTQADIERLSQYQYKLDEEVEGKSWEFLPLFQKLYKEKLLQAESNLEKILQIPFNFSEKEIITLSTKASSEYAASEEQLKNRWELWLKYRTLRYLAASSIHGADIKSSLAREPEARKKTLINEKRAISRILQHPSGYESYIASTFLNAITLCYDPHSVFMDQTDMENYKSGVSSEGFSFGLQIDDNENGEVEITRVAPGGPAWRSNEIHKGDIILGLKWQGKDPLDLIGADCEEIYSILSASNSEPLEFSIRKLNGIVKTVLLNKEKIREEENIVKSFILNGNKKIGYISLPGFYSEWENASGLGCSNDVAKELIKLKKENIEGLILDLRYNGGGSLLEGANLAGIFIDEGPLFMLKNREGKPYIMKDMNRGTIFDGPMLVMVNGQSASASEVLASTLQDYNRALIVGSQTFGKATGQIIMPLDTLFGSENNDLESVVSPYGYVTVTLRKLYRVTGGSTQLRGVNPDVWLPNAFDQLEFREKSYPFPLPFDSIVKKVYYYPLAPLPISRLQKMSSERLHSDKKFQRINSISDTLAMRIAMETMEIPLDLTSYLEMQRGEEENDKQLEAAEKEIVSSFKAQNPAYDANVISMDDYSRDLNSILIKNIESDIYLEESYRIMGDLINIAR